MRYIVYKYTFGDGTVYIGRSRTDENRYNNPTKYKNQEVYKHMLKGYTAEVLVTTDNAFVCCYMEHFYIVQNYENSHNGAVEDNWYSKAAACYDNFDSMLRDAEEFHSRMSRRVTSVFDPNW